MRHEPAIAGSALNPAFRAVDRHPHPAELLAELERHCLALRVTSGGERIDALFARLDEFATLASDLIDGLSSPETIDPAVRRAFDLARTDLEKAFERAEALLSPLSRLMNPNGAGDALLAAADLLATLTPIRFDAARLYAALARELRGLLYPDVRDPLEMRLVDAGFADPLGAARRLRDWKAAVPSALRPATEQQALDRLLPDLMGELERFEDPDATLAGLDEIIGRLPAGIALFTPLEARRSLMKSLLGLLGHAPALSRHLVAQPALIGRLIDSSAYAPLPAPADLTAELKLQMSGADRHAALMRTAEAIGAHRFGLGLQLIEATTDPLDSAAAHSYLAEASLQTMADDVLARMEEKHGRVPGSELLILALGRFGGGALTGNSDLDIVYLFTGDYRAQSDGRKPLDANEYYSRVAQQITTAMSTVTTMGPLYEVDTRLRPWGAKGLLACSLDSFERYHLENAWTWEHMALTRARPVYGSAPARKAVKAIVGRRLRQPRDAGSLLLDAHKMRRDIARHKPARGPYDVKLVRGGLVDLEFAIHVNQLSEHVGIHPHLRTAIRAQVKAGLIDPAVVTAHETLSRLLMVLRLLSPHNQEPAAEQRSTIAQACGFDHWDVLEAAYGASRVIVSETWRSVVARAQPFDG